MGTEKSIDPERIELRADGWERFRRAVHAAADGGPKHKVAAASKSKTSASVRTSTKRRIDPT